jgi:hypothetical protein
LTLGNRRGPNTPRHRRRHRGRPSSGQQHASGRTWTRVGPSDRALSESSSLNPRHAAGLTRALAVFTAE